MKRRARIAQRSARVLAQLPERVRVVDAAWDRDRGECRARPLVPDVECAGRLEAHEVIPRSAWRDGHLCVDNVVIVCRAHHDWIGNNPDEAHARGLHGYSHERNAHG